MDPQADFGLRCSELRHKDLFHTLRINYSVVMLQIAWAETHKPFSPGKTHVNEPRIEKWVFRAYANSKDPDSGADSEGLRGVQSNPTLTQNFISMGYFG